MCLLKVENLKTYFRVGKGSLKSVDGVSFTVNRGETVGLVGESGSGKSVTCLSILRLVARPPGYYAGGSIYFEGKDLLSCSHREIQDIRGNRISMIFQEPMSYLNPVYKIWYQIAEIIRAHQAVSAAEAKKTSIELLSQVGIPSPHRRAEDYPHQLSGGMRQRVMIAMAIACNPSLLIADEPTTALDVTIQAQILELLARLQERNGMAVILVTHDLGVISESTRQVVVMYCGHVVEVLDTSGLEREALHPYTLGLIRSVPMIGLKTSRLSAIPGSVPSLFALPRGCKFHPRCSRATEICTAAVPDMVQVGKRHWVRCHHIDRLAN
ncbi:MAG: ABC transporter ATP-binding protein [Deltaproteobacteria bacterium]|nr:ABC transporter ATP-binding protein [Deltaproteobacteria bacterium]